INKLQKRQPCELCQSLCKQGAISLTPDVTINESLCINCGVCASICPTGTMVVPLEVVEKQYNEVNNNQNVCISCHGEQESTDMNVECLAVLPWEFFAYIALDHDVSIVVRNCESCEHKKLSDQVKLNLERLKDFLGEEAFNDRVTVIDELGELQKTEISRRDLFKLWGEESKRLMTDVVPIKFEANKNARIYRSLLIKKINHLQEQTGISRSYGWNGFVINKNCWGCGTCAIICPQSAITIDKNKLGERKYIHNYARCTHCGICQTVCLKHASTKIITQGDGIHPFYECEIMSSSCSICNDPIEPSEGEVCILCQRKLDETN
ncbi:MAG: 4Fe-4S dicluster domain-containing protein, partial [Turicibacter sp.]